MEHKTVSFDAKEISDEGQISGYGSIYGTVDQGGDVITKGAFDNSLRELKEQGRNVKMLWQHDPSQPIGVWDVVTSDSRGLFMKGRLLPEVAKAREALVLLKAGAMDGLSIGYRTIDAEKKNGPQGLIRELKEVELWETSLVTFPMNTDSRVTDVKQLSSVREVERILRKAGVPGKFAKLVSLYGFDEATNRLSDDLREAEIAEGEEKRFDSLMENLKKLKEAIHA